MESFDVVVVGGRCAGSALAIFLARTGMRVCLVDKARFPSETPSTHVIQPRGVAILAELGVLESVLAQGAVRLDRFSLVNDDVRIDGVLDDEFGYPGLNARRTILDHALQQGAIRSGVDVRNGCRVTGVRMSGERVTGVETADGPLDGGLVVGADGCGSVIAKAVGAHKYLVKPPGRIPVWGYFATGPQEPRLRVAHKGNLGFLASPTDSGLFMAAVAVDHADARDFNREREVNFRNAIRAWSELDEIVRDAERVGPLRVMTNWHSYFRESAGPGWVLVGDAGHFKDFTPAQGIADALCQAKSLSTAIAATSGSAVAQEAALNRWWHYRDRSSYDMHWLAMQMGRPGASSPLITEVLRRIADDPDGATTLLKVLNRDLPSNKLFTAGRLLSAACTTLRNHPGHRRATFAEIGAALAAEMDKHRARLRFSTGLHR
ncbi:MULTISPECIES: NAD(P)/FAD-dependent oxidoreductase [unclassified Mycolicibacterium]|uniref:NAD(P)/FAD-dependent oxidoreductase n=1 Tax=unclassified Mycolicibacterium TaxID=2636767 RepID=UPI0012DEBABB|nr:MULTISPECIES: NAD(P)/FAD-dependent oxidoreductase [unclassified Mycolicibacterium]MUL80519.1 FAD-dependent monooxygenase [Mycolicibacterium sp. CBMA 329]MUL86286.1 FAD-dependent monooxygenase [Mycolicibacterium sp. CBMA 331]MUM01053.1 FAD-dependent monooxygenase [Mycolicibacterium sp. CBMA 334]MUM24947.1 FAD-dependent monooxygenase [Mycolicibacterium sp. CBMA 295]MUM36582.1 FAD-dependent monooxygenase [Mycolicibacterium sp. CBMA 247]